MALPPSTMYFVVRLIVQFPLFQSALPASLPPMKRFALHFAMPSCLSRMTSRRTMSSGNMLQPTSPVPSNSPAPPSTVHPLAGTLPPTCSKPARESRSHFLFTFALRALGPRKMTGTPSTSTRTLPANACPLDTDHPHPPHLPNARRQDPPHPSRPP
ncbi:hypothetical protein C8F01DRAFT_1162026 [Mycena amicta]|nr:hypothetical protein C8F01DRAFT_1162026 [Mycena amicta]